MCSNFQQSQQLQQYQYQIQQESTQIPEIPRSYIINSYLKGVSTRRNFTKEEDKRLLYLVEKYGMGDWNLISNNMPLRNVRQCKDRFNNYLSPKTNLKPWTKEEDLLLIKKFNEFGPKWVKISQFFDGRSDNNLKNRWYTHLQHKKQEITNKIQEEIFVNETESILQNDLFVSDNDVHLDDFLID